MSSKHVNPFVCWLARRDSFPLVEGIASGVPYVLASSASSERLLSKEVLTFNKKRLTLNSNRMAKIVIVCGATTSGLLDHH